MCSRLNLTVEKINSIPWILCLNQTSEYRIRVEIVYFARKKNPTIYHIYIYVYIIFKSPAITMS